MVRGLAAWAGYGQGRGICILKVNLSIDCDMGGRRPSWAVFSPNCGDPNPGRVWVPTQGDDGTGVAPEVVAVASDGYHFEVDQRSADAAAPD